MANESWPLPDRLLHHETLYLSQSENFGRRNHPRFRSIMGSAGVLIWISGFASDGSVWGFAPARPLPGSNHLMWLLSVILDSAAGADAGRAS
jgi:hypothetical protein